MSLFMRLKREALQYKTTKKLLFFTPIAISLLAANFTYAQSAADIEAAQRQSELIQQQEQEQLQHEREEILKRSNKVEGVDTEQFRPKIQDSNATDPCHQINNIVIDGAPNLGKKARDTIISKYTDRCLNVSDIENLLSEITIFYIDKGFITTRAYLPSQDLSTGTLEILVIEGMIEGFIIKDGDKDSVSVNNVFPNTEGEILNLRDLEQGIDQINALQSNDAQLDIEPGSKPGESLVVVHNQATSPFHFNISGDNHGASSTGDTQAAVSASADNLLGANELLSITYRKSVPSHSDQKSSSYNLFALIPYGYSTFSLGKSYSRYTSSITTAGGVKLITEGDTTTNNVGIDHIIYRDQSTRLSLSSTLTTKDTRNFIEGQYLDVSSRKLTILDVGTTLNTDVAGGYLSASLGYSQGLKALNSLEDPDDLPNEYPHAQFGRINASLNYYKPLIIIDKSASYSASITAQKARDTLYGSEQISIGGLYSVRGFTDNSLSGDDGYYFRNELSIFQPMTVAGETINLRFFAGFDTGEVENRADGVPGGHLSGRTLGISTRWKDVFLEMYNSMPVSMPDDMTKDPSRTWIRASYSF